ELGGQYATILDQSKYGTTSNIEYVQSTQLNNPSITGIKITNKDGGKSNYMLPVYTKDETDLTIGLEDFNDGKYTVEHDLYYDDPTDNATVVGQRISEQYPSSYLLTDNTTFNYVDADANIPGGKVGPSDGDIGGWTKFGYRQVYGAPPGAPGQKSE